MNTPLSSPIIGFAHKPSGSLNRKALTIIITAFMLLMTSVNLQAQSKYHINGATGSDNNNGTTWASAFETLQAALDVADAGDEIWIAAGTYYPTALAEASSSDLRDVAFVLKPDVKIYGGFAGSETTLAGRSWATNTTILSGDLTATGGADSVYHVVISAGDVGTALLDGITITGGKANGSGFITVNGEDIYKNYGGGMCNRGSSPTLTNVTISDNSATTVGGGMVNNDSSPKLTNVTISGNSVTGGGSSGGGMYNITNSSPTLTNVIISGNSATNNGGGMCNSNTSSPTLTNVTISGNSANNGGGMYNGAFSSPTLTNVTISGNSATNNGGGMCNSNTSSPTLTNVTISGNSATDGGGMYNGGFSSPTLTNVTISGNTANNGGGMLSFNNSLPGLYNSIVLENNTGIDGDFTYYNSLVQGTTDVTNGNINATGIAATDVFVSPISPAALSDAGDFRLKSNSPAIGVGSTDYWTVNTHTQLGGQTIFAYLGGDWGTIKDLAGNERNKGIIDLGAYESNYFAVRFDTDGGTPEPATQYFIFSTVYLSEPPAPAKTGFTFNGWFDPTNVKWNFTASTVTTDTTLTARWSQQIPVAITTQPQGDTVCYNFDHRISVGATGTNLTYQWYKDDTIISGATNDYYTINKAQFADAGSYTVKVTAATGPTVTSNAAEIKIANPTVKVTDLPDSLTICGIPVTLHVEVTGDDLTYQWYFGYGAAAKPIAGATSNNVAISDDGYYQVIITNNCGSVASNLAYVKLLYIWSEHNADTVGGFPYYHPVYPDSASYRAKYGLLYDFAAAQNACPEGWELPTEAQINQLIRLFSATELKAEHEWLDGVGNNLSAFNALPAGFYNATTSRYENLFGDTYFWAADGKVIHLACHCGEIRIEEMQAANQVSVRCVKRCEE